MGQPFVHSLPWGLTRRTLRLKPINILFQKCISTQSNLGSVM